MEEKMFCAEPIIAVYEEIDDIENADAFLDCYHDLAYHVTKGIRIILETENHFISLSEKGVNLSEKDKGIEEYKDDGEQIRSSMESDAFSYVSTLFVGERLISVDKHDDIYVLLFDDFKFKVVPHDLDANDIHSLCKRDHWSYNHVYGSERHIKRKCGCSGTGELLMDFVSDYVVRCKKCNKSTEASMNAIDAIKDWESGKVYCDLSDITIE